jgi:hypothetical protein
MPLLAPATLLAGAFYVRLQTAMLVKRGEAS